MTNVIFYTTMPHPNINTNVTFDTYFPARHIVSVIEPNIRLATEKYNIMEAI